MLYLNLPRRKKRHDAAQLRPQLAPTNTTTICFALLYSQSTSTFFSQYHCKLSCPIFGRQHLLHCLAMKQARCTWKRGKGILLQRAVHDRECHEAQSHMLVVCRHVMVCRKLLKE